jgi:hypothetical protein
MGGPRKRIKNPRGYAEQLRQQEEKRYRPAIDSFLSELSSAKEKGDLSDASYMELKKRLRGRPSVAAGRIETLRKELTGEIEGTTAKGRSRIGTQLMFDTRVDQPGRKQSLLTPRSNASKSLIGV